MTHTGTQTSPAKTSPARYAAVVALAAALLAAPALPSNDLPALHAAEASAETASAKKTVEVSSFLNEDGTVTITGSGWTSSTEERGAVVAFKWDGGAVINKELPTDPLTGEPRTDERFRNVNFYTVANPDGTFEVTAELPSEDNSNASNADWAAGSEHKLTALAGSLAEGDSAGNSTVSFTVPSGTAEDTETWPLLEAEGATVRIQPFETGEDAKLRLIGEGWTHSEQGGSTVSIKLEYLDGDTVRQYERTDSAISDYLTSKGRAADTTSWVLLMPEADRAQEDQGLYTIGDDGSFDITVDAPEGLKNATTGNYLAVFAQSGRNADGDTSRSARSTPVPINGVAGSLPEQEDDGTVCTIDVSAPTMRIANPTVSRGEQLHLVGSGWCNTENTRATTIAVKIDEGKISHLAANAVHSNRTIWAIIQPNPATGEVDYYLDLPDGTDGTSSPALGEGSHSLRLLSGSLNAGDRSVTYGGVGVLDFTIGEYSPNALPDTVSDSDLSDSARNGVEVTRSGQDVTVRVPGGKPGQWVIATPYLGGSVRSAYGSGWTQLDDNLSLSYTLPDSIAGGSYKLAVQNGEQGAVGDLLGWAPLDIETSSTLQEVSSGATSVGGSQQVTGSATPPSTAAALAAAGSAAANTTTVAPYAAPNTVTTTVRRVAGQAPATALAQAAAQAPAANKSTAKASVSPSASASPLPSASASARSTASASASATASPAPATVASGTGDEPTSWVSRTLTPNNLLLIGAAGIVLALAATSKKPATKTTKHSA